MKADRLVEVMRLVPEGGDWRDLPADIQAEVMGGALHSSGGRVGFFRRLHRDRPAPTVVGSPTQKSTLLWHPFEDRPISVAEAAALQSYPATLERPSSMTDLVALDLFAGTGWGVACRTLGIEEHGVEIMPEALAVREANGLSTIYNDVWEGLEPGGPRLDRYDLLIASPPCQTFSMAGGGAGRAALDEVLQAIDDRAFAVPSMLREFGEKHDPRTALVLTPLAHVFRDAPTYVVLEQVPPVLPVWERYAEVMRRWGYSVWTGNLQAEQYGVPQTRKRAILIARADGVEAKAPAPTHSRYYSRDPQRLDPGVLPWVSMAEALGWGMTERPFVIAGNAVGRAEGIGGSGGKAAVNREKDRGAWIGNQRPGGGESYQERDAEHPVPTISSGSRSARVMRSNYSAGGEKGSTAAERGRTMREDDKPSLAMTGKPGHWVRPSFTVTGGGSSTGGAEPFGRRARDSMPEGASRVSVTEAAALQSYPADFVWDATLPNGKPITKTKQFLQIGNAVPPGLAEAILREVLSRPGLDVA